MSSLIPSSPHLGNNTGIVIESRYYNLTEFDQILFVKCVQIFIYILLTMFILVADIYIIRTIIQKDKLQTIANILILVLFITDMGYAVFYTISSSISIVIGKIWLTVPIAKLLSFFSMIFPNLQCLILALASFEKYIYCVYPFKHQRWFSKKIIFGILGISAVVLTIYNSLLNIIYEATFYPTIVMCFHDFETARHIHSKSILYLTFFSFRISFQAFTFPSIISLQCLTFANSVRTRRKNKRMPASIPQHMEDRMWRRMFVSAFSLFSVIVLYIMLWIWFIVAIVKAVPFSVTSKRIGIIFNIFLPAVVNPIANLLGNKPLREAVLKNTRKPSWIYVVPALQNVHNKPGQHHRYQGRHIPFEAWNHQSQSIHSTVISTDVMEPSMTFENNGGQVCSLVSHIRHGNECNESLNRAITNDITDV